jgi:hypothetical protein
LEKEMERLKTKENIKEKTEELKKKIKLQKDD